MKLTDLESAVLIKLLTGEHTVLMRLRDQLNKCQVRQRQITGHGFFTYFDVEDDSTANKLNFHFGDVVAEIDGMTDGAGFELYIENGKLCMLEGYGYEDVWPNTVGKFTLKYTSGEQRDWFELEKVLNFFPKMTP